MARAKECGAHCLETDVGMSKDGKLIIFHDTTLARTTNIAEHENFQDLRPWRTEWFTAAELKGLDCGSWFLRDDPFGTVHSGEVKAAEYEAIRKQKIPLLTDLLEFAEKNDFPVNLEIKDLGTPAGDTEIVDRVLDTLAKTKTTELVLLSSFREEYLHRVRALNTTIPLAVLAEKQHPPDLLHYLGRFSAAAYHPNEKICSKNLIHNLQQAGYRIDCWTVNNIDRAKELYRSGVGVITDWPQKVSI